MRKLHFLYRFSTGTDQTRVVYIADLTKEKKNGMLAEMVTKRAMAFFITSFFFLSRSLK
jgi:hypothetical protein